MEPLQIKLNSTRETLAVIFVREKSIFLSDRRVQIMEEVKELVPESFKFVSTFGAPISEVQEAKISLIHALHEETFLVVHEFKNAPKTSLKRTADESAEDDEECHFWMFRRVKLRHYPHPRTRKSHLVRNQNRPKDETSKEL